MHPHDVTTMLLHAKDNVQIGHTITENEEGCPTGRVVGLSMGRGEVVMPSPCAMSWIYCTKPPTHTLVLATL